MDPILCLENDIWKAQVGRESVIAVFFDVEKAYDMMWNDGILIKLGRMGVEGRVFNWVKDFLEGREIRVRIGGTLSRPHENENGTPEGSVLGPLLFSVMINNVFVEIQKGIGRSLFADDGALWKRLQKCGACY